MKLKICVFLIIHWIGKVFGDNFTFSYDMALQCKEHLCLHGYSYDTTYQVDSEDLRLKKSHPDVAFEIHIAILASSNGHIMLSPVAKPEPSDPVYEIVVGGGGNKFTELRRNLRKNAKVSIKTIDILSPIEFRPFFIKISTDGLIEFGKEGDKLPLLSYNDVNPLTINYFSFAAWNGVDAKFLYDCPLPDEYGNDTITPNSKTIERKLSSSEELKKILLNDRPSDQAPSSEVTIKLHIEITNVRYDAFETKLVIGIAVIASWRDESLAWNPNKYNGTTKLNFRQGQVWRPRFFLYNAIDQGDIDAKSSEMISIVNSGEATFHFQTELKTYCGDSLVELSEWPNDEHMCIAVIQPWEPHEKILLEKFDVNDSHIKMFAGEDKVIQNEWKIFAKHGILPYSEWDILYKTDNNYTYHESDRYIISLFLTRMSTSLNIIFHTPLIVLVIFVLMSFWSEPLQMSRVWFYIGTSIVICLGLCNIDQLIPVHNVPRIMEIYTAVLAGVIVAFLLQIFLMTTIATKFCKTVFMQSMLTSKMFRKIFFLPAMKTCRNYDSINEGYASHDDDSGVVFARNGNVEEMESENRKYGEKEEFAEAVDKLLFFVYSVVFAVMLACHF